MVPQIYNTGEQNIDLDEIAYVSEAGHIAFKSTQMLYCSVDRAEAKRVVEAWIRFKDSKR